MRGCRACRSALRGASHAHAQPGGLPPLRDHHGLGQLTRTAAIELVAYGITVNAVAPSGIATPMTGQEDTDPARHPPPRHPARAPRARPGGGRRRRLPRVPRGVLRDGCLVGRRRRNAADARWQALTWAPMTGGADDGAIPGWVVGRHVGEVSGGRGKAGRYAPSDPLMTVSGQAHTRHVTCRWSSIELENSLTASGVHGEGSIRADRSPERVTPPGALTRGGPWRASAGRVALPAASGAEGTRGFVSDLPPSR